MSANKPDISQLRKYLNGELDAKAMHRLEHEAQDDPFLMDALEGYELSGKDKLDDVAELQQRLADRVAPKKERNILLWRVLPVAASLLIAISIGYWFLKPDSAKKQNETALLHIPASVAQPNKAASSADSVIVDKSIVKKESTTPLLARNNVRVRRGRLHRAQPVTTVPENTFASNEPVKTDSVAYTASNSLFYKGRSNAVATLRKSQNVANGYQAPATTFGGAVSNKPLNIKPDTANMQRSGINNALAGHVAGLEVNKKDLNEAVVVRGSGYIQQKSTLGLEAQPLAADNKQELKLKKAEEDSTMYLAEVTVPGYADKAKSPTRPVDGWKSYLAYVKQQAIMPDNSIGKVMLAFKVSKDGLIYGIRILQGSTMGINQKAIEILKNGPKWIGSSTHKEVKLKIKFHKGS